MALDTFTLLEIVMKLDARLVLPESYAGGSGSDANRVIRITGWGKNTSLRSDSSPSPAPVAIIAKEYTLASSEATIDLTAAPIVGAESGGVPAATEDLTGKNLIAWHFSTRRSSGTNAAAIIVKPHATNGYDLFGASGQVTVSIDGDEIGCCKTGSRDPVAATDKIIHLTGTTGDKIRVILVFEA
jgi:hypothetical protein